MSWSQRRSSKHMRAIRASHPNTPSPERVDIAGMRGRTLDLASLPRGTVVQTLATRSGGYEIVGGCRGHLSDGSACQVTRTQTQVYRMDFDRLLCQPCCA